MPRKEKIGTRAPLEKWGQADQWRVQHKPSQGGPEVRSFVRSVLGREGSGALRRHHNVPHSAQPLTGRVALTRSREGVRGRAFMRAQCQSMETRASFVCRIRDILIGRTEGSLADSNLDDGVGVRGVLHPRRRRKVLKRLLLRRLHLQSS